MTDKQKIRTTVLLSWAFTLASLFNMFIVLVVVFSLSFRFLGARVGITLITSVIGMSIFFFLFSELLVCLIMRARSATREEYPDLFSAVDELTATKKMRFKPRLFILKMEAPNAVAFGPGFPGLRAIGITDSLYRLLDRNELKGVIAHELAHIRCKDVGIMTMISVMSGTMEKLRQLFLGGKTALGKGPFAWLIGGLLWFLSKVVFGFLRCAVSQERELAADALACSYTGETESLASALRKLGVEAEKKRDKQGLTVISDLFISHPSMDERLASLASLKL